MLQAGEGAFVLWGRRRVQPAIGLGPVNRATALTPNIAAKVVFEPENINALIMPK
jgi:hypothetical protein